MPKDLSAALRVWRDLFRVLLVEFPVAVVLGAIVLGFGFASVVHSCSSPSGSTSPSTSSEGSGR
jgi:hypothetical protein